MEAIKKKMQMLKVDKENALDASEEAEGQGSTHSFVFWSPEPRIWTVQFCFGTSAQIRAKGMRKSSEEKAIKLEEEYQNLQKRLRVTQEESKSAADRLDSIKSELSEAEEAAQKAETDVTKCNKEIIDLEEALDEAQENLNNTLEKLRNRFYF